ncbi:hypothetical protein Mapa_000364 [Marchantia paleacea]|nr:hypothetical protein Mapa_000364 [Marchantia paleacea]
MASTSRNRSRSRQRASTSKNVTTISPENERGRLADLWKEAFPVGTEWDQYEKVYEINWDFKNLENAFEEGGLLFGKRVYLFGCTEPQLVWFKNEDGSDISRVVHIPAVVAVTSPFPPSDKVGIKSVQMEGEMIVPMKEMKMGWIPYIPEDVTEHTSLERYKTQIFTLKCTQRRAALKQLRQERIKKYEYCLPYLYQPLKEEDVQEDTIVNIMYPFDDESKPPVVAEFDWQFDEYEEFADNLIEGEELPAEEKEKFMVYVKSLVMAEKKKLREAREARKRAIEEMSQETKDALQNMHFYKFYPVKTDDTPDISDKKAAFINRYYGKANQVL